MAFLNIRATADERKAFKKLNRAERLSLLATSKTVFNLADLGKYRAKEIAPHFTGQTAKMIRAIKRTLSSGKPEALIISPSRQNYSTSPKSLIRRRYGGSLVGYLHSPEYATADIIRTGEPAYMDRVTEYLNRKKSGIAKGQFNQIQLN